MHTLRELFGTLRSHLNSPRPCTHDIVELITLAVEREPERVAHEWCAYLSTHPALPTLTARSIEELHALELATLDKTHGFAPRQLSQEELIRALDAPVMQHVHALCLDHLTATPEVCQAITQSPHLGTLRELSLDHAQVNHDALDVLCKAPHLDELARLNLRGNDFDGKGLELLAETRALRSLTHLDIGHKRKIDAEHSHVILTTPFAEQLVEFGINSCGLRANTNELRLHAKLQALDISYNYMNDIDLSQFMDGPNSRGLRHLDMSRNSIGNQGLLMVLNATARMHTLHMARTQQTTESVEHIVHSYHAEHLRSLDMSRTKLTTSGALALAEGHFPALQALFLDDCKLECAGLLTLLASDALPSIKTCSLAKNSALRHHSRADHYNLLAPITSGSVLWHSRDSCPLPQQGSMLNVRSNHMNSEQLRDLSEHLGKYAFKALFLGHNLISDEGLTALAKSDAAAHIVELELAETHITHKALGALAHMTSLRSLDLSMNTQLKDECVKTLKESISGLSQLHISHTGITPAGLLSLVDSEVLAHGALCVATQCGEEHEWARVMHAASARDIHFKFTCEPL